ncbi:MAG: hypothetical protein AAGJ54_07210 [Planctomycetota bacterium]
MSTTEKICAYCGEDCSKVRRIKDHRGLYACVECHERAKALYLAQMEAAHNEAMQKVREAQAKRQTVARARQPRPKALPGARPGARPESQSVPQSDLPPGPPGPPVTPDFAETPPAGNEALPSADGPAWHNEIEPGQFVPPDGFGGAPDDTAAGMPAQQPPAGAALGGEDSMRQLFDDTRAAQAQTAASAGVSGTVACENCQAPVRPKDVYCTACGFNRKANKPHEFKDKGEPLKASGGSGFGGVQLGMGAQAGIFAGVVVVSGVIAAVNPGAALAVLGVVLLWQSAAYIMMVVAAFKDGQGGWGLCGLSFIIPVVNLLTLPFVFYYCTVGSERTSWKLNYWASWAAGIAVFLGGAAAIEKFIDESLDEQGSAMFDDDWMNNPETGIDPFGGPAGGTPTITVDPEAEAEEFVPPPPPDPALAIEVARPGENISLVNSALCLFANEILRDELRLMSENDPDYDEYDRILSEATRIDEYPDYIQAEAVAKLEELDDDERAEYIPGTP